MTIEEFIQECKAAYNPEQFVAYGPALRITERCDGEWFCPLTFMYWIKTQKVAPLDEAANLADELELSQDDANAILFLADDDPGDYNLMVEASDFPIRRRALLAAFGMEI